MSLRLASARKRSASSARLRSVMSVEMPQSTPGMTLLAERELERQVGAQLALQQHLLLELQRLARLEHPPVVFVA